MRKHLSTIFLVLVLLVGVGLLVYPTFSDYYNSLHQTRAIAQYVESINRMEAVDYSAVWEEAEEYNRSLIGDLNRFILDLDTPEGMAKQERYNSLLGVAESGVMGYIEIPKISVSLPIYHGTDTAVLQVAIGHIEGTSLPTGMIGEHVAVSGHRGLPSARLFTNLDQLQMEDVFSIRVLDRVFTYEVDQIRIVLPNELQDLDIDPEQTYCTLVTCTPYGINSHRMLVRGHLIENPEAEVQIRIVADANQIEPLLVAPVVAAPILLLLLIILLVSTSGGNKKRKERGVAE